MSSIYSSEKTIGIIGGGQLGRMLAMAASHMGYQCHIYTPEEDSPASHVAKFVTIASYEDAAALEAFAKSVDVVTFEFENVPAESLNNIEKLVPVHPKPDILHLCRNRLREKDAINKQGIKTAPYAPVRSLDDLQQAIKDIGTPCVLKTCELGYDGKGQVRIQSEGEVAAAWESINNSDTVLEGWVDFKQEISVIVARNENGDVVTFDPSWNIHRNHILAESIVPCGLSGDVICQAKSIGRKLADAFGLVGIMAVELFVTEDEELLVNELAPRPHNSGHWTMEAAATSQFEQQIRAITGDSLGGTELLCPAKMINLIGDDVERLDMYRSDSHAHIHLYGKRQVRDGRKMGHVTLLQPNGS